MKAAEMLRFTNFKTLGGQIDSAIEAAAAKAAGLLIPDEKTCLRCHNAGAPTPEHFDYKTYWEKIKHPKSKA